MIAVEGYDNSRPGGGGSSKLSTGGNAPNTEKSVYSTNVAISGGGSFQQYQHKQCQGGECTAHNSSAHVRGQFYHHIFHPKPVGVDEITLTNQRRALALFGLLLCVVHKSAGLAA
jgi:hypothetical protein